MGKLTSHPHVGIWRREGTHFLVPATDHAAYGEAHAPVLARHVGEQFGGCRHRDTLAIPQIVQPG